MERRGETTKNDSSSPIPSSTPTCSHKFSRYTTRKPSPVPSLPLSLLPSPLTRYPPPIFHPTHPIRHTLSSTPHPYTPPPSPTSTRHPQPNIHPPSSSSSSTSALQDTIATKHPPLTPSLLPPKPPQPPSPTTDKTDCRNLQTGAEKQSRSVRWRCCASLDGHIGVRWYASCPGWCSYRTSGRTVTSASAMMEAGNSIPCKANKQTRVRLRTPKTHHGNCNRIG